MMSPDSKVLTIQDLYPHLSNEEAQEAEANIERYLEVVLRIYERVRQDPVAYARFLELTGSEKHR